MPLPDAEVDREVVGGGEPGHVPPHPLPEPLDVLLRRAGHEHEGGVASVQVGQVADLVGVHRTARAALVWILLHYMQAFEQAGCDELILFPCSADPEQVELLAKVVL